MKQRTQRSDRSLQIQPASTFWQKLKKNNRSGEVFYGKNGEVLHPKRTIISADFEIEEKNKHVIRCRIKVYKDLHITNLWSRNREEWIVIGHFEEINIGTSSSMKTYQALIDLDQVTTYLSGNSKYFGSEEGLANELQSGTRYHLYVQATSAMRRPPVVAKEVEATTNGFSFRYPLGKARRTRVGVLSEIQTTRGTVTPYINKSGFLSLAANESLEVYANVFNEGITYSDGILSVAGRIEARHSKITKATVILVGRTSGYVSQMSTNLGYLKRITEREFGHYKYKLNAELSLESELHNLQDDIIDYYVELEIAGAPTPVRKRFGKTRYLLRRNSQPFQIISNDFVYSFVPYFTFQAKNPSLQVEVFDKSSFEHFATIKDSSSRRSQSRPTWLVGEMPYKAQDNGLAFFKYLQDHRPEIDSYYVISKESPERSNLQGYSNIVDFRSKEHIDVVARAQKIISTHAPSQLYPSKNPSLISNDKATKVFLQHGVTAGKWIKPVFGRNSSDFQADQIMVCSEREKEFFVHDLEYDKNQVAVVGFTRFDYLFDEKTAIKDNQLFVMPTWRQWLQDPETFEESDYYKNWMSFLTGDGLSRITKARNLNIVFCLHPNMQQYTHLFRGIGARVVFQGEVNVQELIKESAAMVTDYSSAALDFAFLNKPVFYYQFDADRFDLPHADPLTELPGPVVVSERDLIGKLEESLEAGFIMGDEYKRRADKLTAYRDQNNCERTFEAIASFTPNRKSLEEMVKPDFRLTLQRYIRRHRLYPRVSKAFYYAVRRIAPLDSNKIVFESTLAKSFGGNPRAIYDELVRRGDPRTKVIVSNRRERNRDEKTVVVKRHSWSFLWHLATAKYWVNDQNFPHYIKRRNGGIYVQTWHGTPLKKMFLDQENFFGRDAGYIDRVKKMVAQWNRVVSPNPHTTSALRSSYGYKGPVYELGYPRNDILSSPNRDQIGAAIRQRLGIDNEKFVVLYAPTFRDDKPTKPGRFAFHWPFAPATFDEKVDDNIVLLLRTHNLVDTKIMIPDELSSRIINVSKYPDIQELFLASDMLVTDYSSSFFDYAILDRPIAFFAYDLENYRDSLRGFYLDYEKDLPGPILEDADSLFTMLNKMASHDTRNAIDRSFIQRFAPFEDGYAARRVVDELL